MNNTSQLAIDIGHQSAKIGSIFDTSKQTKDPTIVKSQVQKSKYDKSFLNEQFYHLNPNFSSEIAISSQNKALFQAESIYSAQNTLDEDKLRIIMSDVMDMLEYKNKDTLVIIIDPLESYENKRRYASMAFDLLDFSKITFVTQGPLTASAQGLTRCLVVDSGEKQTRVCAIYEDFDLTRQNKQSRTAGKLVSEELRKNLNSYGYEFSDTSYLEHVQAIKEKHAECLPQNKYERENLIADFHRQKFHMHSDQNFTGEVSYYLPDGREIKLGQERRVSTEVLFNPAMFGHDIQSIPELIVDAMKNISVDLKKDLVNNILLIGGNSSLGGFQDRVKEEFEEKFNGNKNKGQDVVKVIASANKDRAQWVGASFQFIGEHSDQDWIFKIDWDENGDGYFEKFKN